MNEEKLWGQICWGIDMLFHFSFELRLLFLISLQRKIPDSDISRRINTPGDSHNTHIQTNQERDVERDKSVPNSHYSHLKRFLTLAGYLMMKQPLLRLHGDSIQ